MNGESIAFKVDVTNSKITELKAILMDSNYAIVQVDYLPNNQCKYTPLGYYRENGWNESILPSVINFYTYHDVDNFDTYEMHEGFDDDLFDAYRRTEPIAIAVRSFNFTTFDNDVIISFVFPEIMVLLRQ